MTKQWEYLVTVFKDDGELQAQLNILGQAGWELVSLRKTLRTFVNSESFVEVDATFKRPLEEAKNG